MTDERSDGRVEPKPEGLFVTTRWSVVLTVARSDTTRSRDALAHLCRTYWYPLYAFARRRGHSPPDAEDLTQEFFARLLEGNWLAQADRQRGRFRTFLLTAMKHFLANEWHKARTRKRGNAGAGWLSNRWTMRPPRGATRGSRWSRRRPIACSSGVGRWTRHAEAELSVYAPEAEIVALETDPAADPVTGGALSVGRIILRRQGQGLTATVVMNVGDALPVTLSFDVTLRLQGKDYPCGQLFQHKPRKGTSISGAGKLEAQIEPVGPQVTTADVILTPNRSLVESYGSIARIWGKEVVFKQAPLTRQDLTPQNPPN